MRRSSSSFCERYYAEYHPASFLVANGTTLNTTRLRFFGDFRLSFAFASLANDTTLNTTRLLCLSSYFRFRFTFERYYAEYISASSLLSLLLFFFFRILLLVLSLR